MIPYLNILGKRVSIAAQWRRRVLVVAKYVLFVALLRGTWFLDQWKLLSEFVFALFFLTIVWLSRTVRFPADERELHALERSRRYASRVVLILIFFTGTCVFGQRLRQFQEWDHAWSMPSHHPDLGDNNLAVLIISTLFIASDLHYSIVLWTEPDMEPADEGSRETSE